MPEQEVREDINPQLCKTLNPKKHKWDSEWIAEPKFDGIRCMMVIEHRPGSGKHVQAYSRNGKPLYNMGYIYEDLKHISPGVVLDGEVYTRDWNLSMGIVKSSVTEHQDANKLRYHVWDCLIYDEFKASWKDRFGIHPNYTAVSNLVRKQRLSLLERCSLVETVPSVTVHNDEELKSAYTTFLTQGYEGAILKNPQGPYEGGRRSPYWLKIKPWTDADLKVVGAYPGEGKHIGRIGGLVLEGSAEWGGSSHFVHTEVGTGFTDQEREWWQEEVNKGTHLGRIVEIKFQDITEDNSCRFPVYHRLREDK